jgi:TPR repeat protein
MKRDEPQQKCAVSSSRPIPRPAVPQGSPLRQLKELLYSLYLEAGTPTLDDIVKWIYAAYTACLVPSVPSRDTVRDCIGSPQLPAKQSDAITIAGTLASHGCRNPDDAKAHACQLWVDAYEWVPLGRPITDLNDPFTLEVHRAIDTIQGHTDLPLLPPYVERDHDRELADRVQEATGGQSKMIVLVGGSSTGKTRTCWEAIHKLPEGWRLWHPFDPTRPEAALDTLPRIGPRTVVWLNETQHYLLARGDLGERVAAKLRTILTDPARAPVLVLGTMWPEYWDTLTREPAAGRQDLYAQARALLTGTNIAVPDAFSDTALTALRAAAGADSRLTQAYTYAQDGQITQYLAGVPVLLDRYRNAPPAAKALIEAAMEARWLGHSLALPHSLLEAAASRSLTDQQWDELGEEDWLEQALAYAAVPCRGVRGPLTRIRPRAGQPVADHPYYRLSDYLEQHGRTIRLTHSVTAALFEALIAHATKENLIAMGSQAERRGLHHHAFRLYEAAADTGDITALRRAAHLLVKAGRTEEAITWYQRAADTGDATALRRAAHLLAEAGRTEEAITWYQRAADTGDATALRRAAHLLAEAGRTEEAITWYQRAADAGDTTVLRDAAYLLVRVERTDEAITWYQRAADAGDTTVLRDAAHLLAGSGRIEEAISCLDRAADAGDITARWEMADLLIGAGRTDEAITWLQTRAETGDQTALREAIRLLTGAGRTDEAITWLQTRAETGDRAALWALSRWRMTG